MLCTVAVCGGVFLARQGDQCGDDSDIYVHHDHSARCGGTSARADIGEACPAHSGASAQRRI